MQIPQQPKDSIFTQEQWNAIAQQGSNLLVSASAGSGKTAVLVERIFEKIKSGISLQELLIVTFTEAAAKEMKERIEQKLKREVESREISTSQRSFYLKQIRDLPLAQISTIHSFCLSVIRRYYYTVDLDPVFRMLTDASSQLLLKESVWNEIKEERYAQRDEELLLLSDVFGGDRSDDRLDDLIFELHDYARAFPDPEVWIDSFPNRYRVGEELTRSELFIEHMAPGLHTLLRKIEQRLLLVIQNIERHCNTLEEDACVFHKYYLRASEDIETVRSLQKILRQTEDDRFFEQHFLNAETKDSLLRRLPTITQKDYKKDEERKEEHLEVKDRLKSLLDLVKEDTKRIYADFYQGSMEELRRAIDHAGSIVEALSHKTQLFYQRYQERKREDALMDFSDLEQIAYHILRSEQGNNEARAYYQDRFHEVMIDEYQDVNAIQEAILSCLTEGAQDHFQFMVGDVKQSIYGFRLADPTLFLNKYERYANHEGGQRIILAKNFRSRPQVLEFTNYVFRQIMDKDLGEMEYDEQARLRVGNSSYAPSENFACELLIYDQQKVRRSVGEESKEAEQEENGSTFLSGAEGEARIVAQRIQNWMQSGFQIFDRKSGEERAVTYRDIVCLVSSRTHNSEIMQVFEEFGIPLATSKENRYFKRIEIEIMLSILKITDNPLQDIPLAAVLRSPVFALNERELSMIRLCDMEGNYFTALNTYVRVGEDGFIEAPSTVRSFTGREALLRTLQRFLTLLNDWREYIIHNGLVLLILKIYEDTDFLNYVGGLAGGEQRQANLHALYQIASEYEKIGMTGLFAFVRHIERLKKREQDLEEVSLINENENVVRLITIHQSKGLEFPIVFLMSANKRFHTRDFTGDIICSKKLGPGIPDFDPERRIKKPIPISRIYREIEKRHAYAEEMRKLYVAMTRAEQKLCIVAQVDSMETELNQLSSLASETDEVLSEDVRMEQGSPTFFQWIFKACARHSSFARFFPEHTQAAVIASLHREPIAIHIEVWQRDRLSHAPVAPEVQPKEAFVSKIRLSNRLVLRAERLLHAPYPYEAAVHTTGFQSVSELKRDYEDPNLLELTESSDVAGSEVIEVLPASVFSGSRSQGRYRIDEFALPDFMKGRLSVTATEVGTATHTVLQRMNLKNASDRSEWNAMIEVSIERGEISYEAGEAISVDSLIALFESEPGRFLIQNDEKLHKEQAFSLLLPASSLFSDMKDDRYSKIMIHGMIDAYVESEHSIVLFDYKTDVLPLLMSREEKIEELKRRYEVQLQFYAQALETTLHKKVSACWILAVSEGLNIKLSY